MCDSALSVKASRRCLIKHLCDSSAWKSSMLKEQNFLLIDLVPTSCEKLPTASSTAAQLSCTCELSQLHTRVVLTAVIVVHFPLHPWTVLCSIKAIQVELFTTMLKADTCVFTLFVPSWNYRGLQLRGRSLLCIKCKILQYLGMSYRNLSASS